MKRLNIPRGTVLVPVRQEVSSSPVATQTQYLRQLSYMGSYGYSSGVIGIHVYLGRNEWLLPSGRIRKGQTFHRKILNEFRLGWWKVVE